MDYSRVLIGGADELTCPRCRETRQTEIVKTGARREAFCAVCSYVWAFEVVVCLCGEPPAPHYHPSHDLFPLCPKCGKRARLTKPA